MRNRNQPVIVYVLTAFLLLTGIELGAILWLNQGTFIFTLDDPYIHLAVAENLLKGHYGVNLHEYSAPSSSILWPLLIAPISGLASSGLALLLLNTGLGLASLYVFNGILDQAARFRNEAITDKARLLLSLAFIIVGNLIGLAFTGMEHNLQVLLALVVLLGLLKTLNGHQPSKTLWLAILLMPLVRYEAAAISAGALLYLFLQRYYWQSVLTGVLITLALAAFSLFLLSLGLGYLPDSVLAKSDVASTGLAKLAGNFVANVTALSPPMPKGLMLLAGMLFLLVQALIVPARKLKILLACMALAIFLHLLGGRIGWLWRYELYIWSVLFSLTMVLALVYRAKMARVMSGLILLVSVEHVAALLITPAAASNIYLQQYQMHRFITEFYQKPVAINDLGWPSYKNAEYVLDLWGLGSSKARELRKTTTDALWMNQLAEQHNVNLIMIYHHPIWFAQIPNNWIKLGELDSDRLRITARMAVSFYSRCEPCMAEQREQLEEFAKSLPEGAMFVVSDGVTAGQK